MIRAYLNPETHKRVLNYAASLGIKPHTGQGITEVYTQIINSLLDENGHIKDRLVLTDAQNKILEEISTALGQPPERTVQEMINYALLIYTTHISLREVIVAAAPLIMDNLVTHNPDIAKAILKGLQKSKPASPP